MSWSVDRSDPLVQAAVERVVADLIDVQHWPDCTFVGLPLSYPDGSDVSVKVARSSQGFSVSDNEFAFREAQVYGAEPADFARLAESVLHDSLLARVKNSIWAYADAETLRSAICEVAHASWSIANQAKSLDETREIDDEEGTSPDSEILAERLVHLFGRSSVSLKSRLAGASTNEWKFTAIVRAGDIPSAFQSVSGRPYSVYRTSSAFADVIELPKPPRLIAVVPSKAALGTKLGLISRSGYVIEHGQSDAVFLEATSAAA